MVEKVIRLPLAFGGSETEPPVPDTLGVDVEVLAVPVNYRDVGKARVRGTAKEIDELTKRADAWFIEHWPAPSRE